MKRNSFFKLTLAVACISCSLTASASTSPSSSAGQGIDYYKAGFPLIAKPLLIAEINSTPSTLTETCFTLGNIYFNENKPDSAAIYFTKGNAANAESSLNAVGLTMLKIKANPTLAEEEFQKIVKLKNNKKNIDLLIAIANAYLFNNNIDKSVEYQDKAKNIKSKYAPLSILQGDIELAKKNVGGACQNYEMAIYHDDKCKEAYIKYARAYKNVNSTLAIEMLGKLKEKVPAFLLSDRELADIYYANNNFSKAAEYYAVYIQSGNSDIQDLTKYAFTLFLYGQFAKSLEVCNMGLQKAPRNPVFNRLAMYNNVDMKHTAEALTAADFFFNKTEKAEFSSLDYRYYGQALKDNKQIDLAIVQYEKAISMDSTKTDLWKEISNMYNTPDKTDYVKSLEAYKKYVNGLAADKVTADDNMAMGRCNYGIATDTKNVASPELKKSSLQAADSLFAKVASLEPNGYRGNFWRARANSAIDPDTKLGLAKPYYEQTATLLEAKADARFNPVLIECYNYLGYYFLLQNDNNNSLSYWNKVLAIDPNNANAKKAAEGINKVLKKK